jgi:carboxymethylenebutenolidase
MSDALMARSVMIKGHGGDEIEAYLAQPVDREAFGAMVVIHHMPGYDRGTKEMVRRFAAEGYAALCPNLYWRDAPGASPDDAAAAVRAAGGVPEDRLLGDLAGAAAHLRALPGANGRVGVIGHCSGGRQAFLAGCELDLDAAVDCYGAFVVEDVPPGVKSNAHPLLHLADRLSCPLLGLFGADDQHPAPEHTARLAAELTGLGKDFEFHTSPDAGHAFFAVDRPSYRPAAAIEGWSRIFAFLARHLS